MSFLIDGAAYFAALRAAAARAQRVILLIGWDFDSRTELVRGDPPDDGLPTRLGPFLDALARRNRHLQVYVLEWDFAMLYALDREVLPIYKLGWRTHRRVQFRLDARHPVGASHHQKLVVIDDALAFLGGLDLTRGRWDTPAHAPDDPRRVDPDGKPYVPFHDVQLMVTGPVAAALGELARERWHRATEGALKIPPARAGRDPWPAGITPDVREVEIGIARTAPAYLDQAEVREIEQLYLDAIAAAEHSIYIENQYLTAEAIGEALAARLREPDGPEVVLVSRLEGGGWLEKNTMEVLRGRWLERLRESDAHGRLGVFYPYREGLPGGVNLHAKLMLIDARFLHVGSANLANRSMGLDSECDLSLEATEPPVAAAISRFHDRLLAEHLGVEPERVANERRRSGSLIATIERLSGGPCRLEPIETEVAPEIEALLPANAFIDPERPIDPDELAEQLLPREEHAPVGRRLAVIAVVLAGLAALAAGWRWSPLGDSLDIGTLEALLSRLRELPAAPIWVLGAYVLASFTAMPITVMIVATAVVFGAAEGWLYAICGSLLGAVLTFGLGHLLGRETIRRLAGSRLNRLSRHLGHRGLLAVIAVRIVPVAPFTVVNLVAGASHIRLRDFVLGSLLGMAPGITAIIVFSDRLMAALREPSLASVGVLAGVAAVVAAGAFGVHRWSRRRRERRAPQGSGQPE